MELLERDGMRLAYWDQGSGQPVVLIHGVGTPGEIWTGDLEPLARHCRVITYDRRGWGASSESPRDWRAHCGDAIELIEALDAAPAVLVGYSAGSIAALDLALRRPELVAALVVLDPAFNVKRCLTPGFVRMLVTARVLRRVAGDRRGAERWLRYVTGYRNGGSAFEESPADRGERLLKNSAGIFADIASGSGEHVDESRLAAIDLPVTLVEAELSPPFLRRSCGRLRRLLPQARAITLANSGHAVGFDAPDELLAILRETASAAGSVTPRSRRAAAQ
jgi:pimeloyl-ACP methyl ester carboxylesterase